MVSPSTDIANLLLTLAWLPGATTDDLDSLHFAGRGVAACARTLTQLRSDGLIDLERVAVRASDGITRPQRARWFLTDAGRDVIRHAATFPDRAPKRRYKGVRAHDARTLRMLVFLIVQARAAGLRNVFVRYEVRLHPEKSKPIADALITIQLGSASAHPTLVPWSNDPALDDETRVRYLIEADGDTEAYNVIRGKGQAYAATWRTPAWQQWWEQTYGPLPTILWVAPGMPRLTGLSSAFQSVWPEGRVFYTTDDHLLINRWWRWDDRWVVFPLMFAPPAPGVLPAAVIPSTRVTPSACTPSVAPPMALASAPPPVATIHSSQPVLPVRVSPLPVPAVGHVIGGPPPTPDAIKHERALHAASMRRSTAALQHAPAQPSLSAPIAALHTKSAGGRRMAMRAVILITLLTASGALLRAAREWEGHKADAWVPPPTVILAGPAIRIGIDGAIDASTHPLPTATLLPCAIRRVQAEEANVRDRPALDAPSRALLPRGTALALPCSAAVTADGETWVFVRTAAGLSGWVAQRLLIDVPPSINEQGGGNTQANYLGGD